jgi:lipopolysaccharide heptosyltransferase I
MQAAAQPQRVLIIRPSALGDVCRTVPVLASLRRGWPEARIDWLVQDGFAPAIEAHPALNEIITFPRSRFARWWWHPGAAWEVFRWLAGLRKRRYDVVIDCQGLGRSGVMAFATAAPRRIGLRKSRELAWFGYNQRVPHDPNQPTPIHTVDQMLALAEAAGVQPICDMSLYVAEANRQWWQEQRESSGWGGARYAVIAPTARWPSKRWPIDRFAQLIQPLYERGFERIVVIGAPGESDQVRELFYRYPPEALSDGASAKRSPVADLVGKSSIGQTMAVIAEAGLVIANDSAPLHMAVGFQRPCVALFGPTDPEAVGPYGMANSVVRGFSPGEGESISFKEGRLGDRLMRLISTAAVLQRIDRVLATAESAARSWRSRVQPSFDAQVPGGVMREAAS